MKPYDRAVEAARQSMGTPQEDWDAQRLAEFHELIFSIVSGAGHTFKPYDSVEDYNADLTRARSNAIQARERAEAELSPQRINLTIKPWYVALLDKIAGIA